MEVVVCLTGTVVVVVVVMLVLTFSGRPYGAWFFWFFTV